jgi:large subunit ribosomal protein L17
MAAHRDALLQNLAVSLIMNKRINTTVAKAKALRRFVEPIITRSKDDSMHNRRTAFSYLQDKHAVKELFATVGDKVANRPGGYTRIIRTGFRLGDAAEMCMIELVDFNELMLADTQTKKAKTRRSRSGKRSSDSSFSNENYSSSPVVAAAAGAAMSATSADTITEEADVVQADTTELEHTDADLSAPAAEQASAELEDASGSDGSISDLSEGVVGSVDVPGDEASADASADASTDPSADSSADSSEA